MLLSWLVLTSLLGGLVPSFLLLLLVLVPLVGLASAASKLCAPALRSAAFHRMHGHSSQCQCQLPADSGNGCHANAFHMVPEVQLARISGRPDLPAARQQTCPQSMGLTESTREAEGVGMYKRLQDFVSSFARTLVALQISSNTGWRGRC